MPRCPPCRPPSSRARPGANPRGNISGPENRRQSGGRSRPPVRNPPWCASAQLHPPQSSRGLPPARSPSVAPETNVRNKRSCEARRQQHDARVPRPHPPPDTPACSAGNSDNWRPGGHGTEKKSSETSPSSAADFPARMKPLTGSGDCPPAHRSSRPHGAPGPFL